MTRRLSVLVVMLCAFAYSSYAQTWENVGAQSSVSAAGSSFNNLAIDADGNYYLSYYDLSVSKGSVQKFNGTSWSHLGGVAGITTGSATYNSLSVDALGNTYYTNQWGWPDAGMEVRKHNGTTWQQLTNATSNTINYHASSVSASNILFVYSGDGSGSVHRFVADAWQQVGPTGFSNGASFAEMAIGSNNVVYTCNVASGNVQVYQNSTQASASDAWTLVGGTTVGAASSSEQYTSDIALDADNNIYVAYVSNSAGGQKLNVKKYDGTSWIQLGEANFSSGRVQHVAIAVSADGKPYVVASRFEDDDFLRNRVYAFDEEANTWNTLGEGFISAGQATYNDLVVDNTNGYLVVAFSEGGTKVLRYSINDSPVVCTNTEPGANIGDTGCVSFSYDNQNTTYTTVRAADGNIWLQQNLGSTTIATTLDEEESYGDLFQWGRWDDGHQKRNSATTSSPTPNNPLGIQSGLSSYIIGTPAWWSSNALTDEWNANTVAEATEVNSCDPCKALGQGWALPTQQHWTDLIAAESITNPASAFASNLKLPANGFRSSSSGTFDFVGQRGYYWSSGTANTGGRFLYIGTTIANPSSGAPRGQGAAIRCVKQSQVVQIVSVEVETENGVNAEITTNGATLQLVASVTPAEANQQVEWTIESGDEFASIEEDGLITAIADGTVIARATSVVDATKFDDIEIIISNQVVDNFPSPYCDIDEDNSYDIEPITLVDFGDINNTSSNEVNGTPVLENFTHLQTDVQQGAMYILTVEGNTAGNFENYITAYIDWNQNNTFDDDEIYFIGEIEDSEGNDDIYASAEITVPLDALLGSTRMRIVKSFDDNDYQTACESIDYGQAEDYTLVVVAGSTVPVIDVVVATQNDVPAAIADNYGTLQLVATVNPSDANQVVIWSVQSGIELASVNAQGLVTATANGNGSVVVRATSLADNTKYDEIEITISNQVGQTEYCDVEVEWDVEPITRVSFSNVDNETSSTINGTPAYEDFTAQVANVEQTETYTLIVEGNTGGNYPHDIRVFIDWNQNFVFDTVNEYYAATLTPSTGEDGVQATIEITIPQTALVGTTRMRIIKDQWTAYEPDEIDACTDAYYGQIEDYTLSIISNNTTAPVSIVVTTENSVAPEITTENGTLLLVATVAPVDANQEVEWSVTSGSAFASVNTSGLVTALSNGVAVIRATSVESDAVFGEITITIDIDEIDCEPVPTFLETFDGFSEFPEQCWAGSHTGMMMGITGTTDKAVQIYSFTNANDDFYIISPAVSTINGQYVLEFDVESISAAGTTVQVGTLSSQTSFSDFAPVGAAFEPTAGTTYTSPVIPATSGHLYTAIKFVPNGSHRVIAIDNVEWKLATVGVSELEEMNLHVYPNPTSGILNITSAEMITNISIYNAVGKLVKSFASQRQINLSEFDNGVYVVKVQTISGNQVVRRIVKS